MPKFHQLSEPGDRSTLAIFWFARLVESLARRDFIIACEARNNLNSIGFHVTTADQMTSPKRGKRKGGAA